MFHSFKKNVAKATAGPRGINPGGEFLDYKNRLQNIKRNLNFVDKKMEEALRAWRVLIIEQRKFAHRVHEGYPIVNDDMETHARDFSEGAQKLYDYFLRERNSEAAPFERMHQQVKQYLTEIAAVERMYPELLVAKSESERYQSKVDAMDRSGRGSDVRRSRNVQKMDSEKERVEAIRRQVISSQKSTYAKASTVYKAALCAYWWTHERHTQVLLQMMEKTSQFAAEAGEELLKVDITQLSMGDVNTENVQWEPEPVGDTGENYTSTDPATEGDTITPVGTMSSNGMEHGSVGNESPAGTRSPVTPMPWPTPTKTMDKPEKQVLPA